MPRGMGLTSTTRCTLSHLSSATRSVGTTSANSEDSAARRVRASPKAMPSVSSPVRTVGALNCPTWASKSMNCTTSFRPSGLTPTRGASWSRMSTVATPIKKPVMTACETKRSSRPRRSKPKRARDTPTRTTSKKSAWSRWASG